MEETVVMNEETGEAWRIVNIPGKPPIPTDQQPTVNVYASMIEPNLANTLIRRLNQIAPLENLRHVKRIRKKAVEGGKSQLSAILCLACEDENQWNCVPENVQELVNSYQLSPFITQVCKYAASSKEEWEGQCKLWPTSYHPPTYNINGVMGFSEEDSQSVFSFMKFAIELAKSSEERLVNAAVIVDPSNRQIIASACDQINSWLPPESNASMSNGCIEQAESLCSHPKSSQVATNVFPLSNGSSDKFRKLYTNVSCLNPWRSSEQRPRTSSCYWHPLRHAAIVAIEVSAAMDRHLFPALGHIGDECYDVEDMQSSFITSPAKRPKTNLTNVEKEDKQVLHTKDSCSISERPYLCTGYDIFLVWEPCTMCAMALVHQRIRRIFYAFPNPKAGALGSVHRLQGEKSLNHHYAVFRVLLPYELPTKGETLAEIADKDKRANALQFH
ncbi:hypothetical protein HS088_TW10G00961 [Tripterygium wilfordii]|uniref:CMP/dCMP-type deaminase domain-containing protein n=1 Tax=Tripterygium wilfordii TaxID=458696 RepID=A0A7J7D6M9_TRIWF|nr:tRNA-specific adenosine deaminase TAD3-like isoform X2 [Tripterygium wilfordii]KAF5741953.1 hypothetical protein HS088_TW10G00961 [Tripterygium wilfordii]